jgi:hypothetical protein
MRKPVESTGDTVANPEQVERLKRVEDWSKWRANHPDIIPDLSSEPSCDCILRFINSGVPLGGRGAAEKGVLALDSRTASHKDFLASVA